jgi:Peptidase family M28/PDZ domain/PA domain
MLMNPTIRQSTPAGRTRVAALMVASLVSVGLSARQLAAQAGPSPAERADRDIKWLASDELEGREPGSQGIEKAATFIENEFRDFGLKSPNEDGSYRQMFTVNLGVNVDSEATRMEFVPASGDAIKLKIGEEFRPMAVGGSGEVSDAELVFVGYGISAPDLNYDEYKSVDVTGKVVVFIRMEPQLENAESVFNGSEISDYASITKKLNTAREKGAVGAIMINNVARVKDGNADEIAEFRQFGNGEVALPFFQMTRVAFEKLIDGKPIRTAKGTEFKTLADVEADIDARLEPLSQAVEGFKVNATAKFSENVVETFNIVGIVEGEGPNADETIVIGGHYDHLGYGGYGSNAPGRREVHNGADDNATGTVAVVELARRFAKSEKKPGRRLVFAAFSGEERGLLGSAWYVDNPLFPIEKTVAMINYDMIGRLRDDKLTIFGTGTAAVFDAVLDKANETEPKLVLDRQPSPFAGSDHMPFVRVSVPVMFFHTGLTDIYHTPEDDYETLNIPGMNRVIDFTERVTRELADAGEKPVYVEPQTTRRSRAWLGVRFDFEKDERGAVVEEVPEGSPALTAGLEVGDVVLSINDSPIADRQALAAVLAEKNPGDKVTVVLVRGTEEQTVEVELGTTPRRRRTDN